jgi:cobyrinic acid a,c-diamide synthase
MLRIPRLAIGSHEIDVDPQPMCWAILAILSGRGQQVQHYHSTASFPRWDVAVASTGVSSRHLDSWLMTPDVCRETFAHSAGKVELAVVEGVYASARPGPWQGGRLDELCDWLDLPRLVVLDARRIDGCCLPERPANADGLLLDHVRDCCHFSHLQTTLESLWGIPVLGGLEGLPQVRSALLSLPRGATPERSLCQELAAGATRYVRVERLRELAARRPFPAVRPYLFRSCEAATEERITVAVAFDDAFRCYFPDTLELLELDGASVVDFSPLRDEALPADAELIYLGCGHPERHAAALAENHCMRFALREHLCAGRRIYAEGGGLAYLCDTIVTPAGERVPMVGAFPIVASVNPQPAAPAPTAITLARKCWLGRPGTELRGYRGSNWLFERAGNVNGLANEPGHEFDLVGRYMAIGSQLHVNFAAQAAALQSLLRPVARTECKMMDE